MCVCMRECMCVCVCSYAVILYWVTAHYSFMLYYIADLDTIA